MKIPVLETWLLTLPAFGHSPINTQLFLHAPSRSNVQPLVFYTGRSHSACLPLPEMSVTPRLPKEREAGTEGTWRQIKRKQLVPKT